MVQRLNLVVASLVALAAPCSAAEEAVSLQVRWARGPLWTVEQRLELASANKGKGVFAGGAGVAEMLVKGTVVTTEKWTDEGTESSEERLTGLLRTFVVSKISAQKKSASATMLQGLKFTLAVADKQVEIRAPKDGPDPVVRALLSQHPLDPVELLLPASPVAEGAEWEIDAETVMRFQRAICLGVAGARGGARDDVSLLLKSLAESSPASAGKAVKARLVKVVAGIGRIEFEGDKTGDAEAERGIKGPLFDVPPSTTKIEGVLEFDVSKGRPVRLTWTQVHEMGDFTPRPGTPGAGVKVPGFTETWKLDKAWK